MRIIGPPSASRSTVLGNLSGPDGAHPRFVAEMFPPLWDAAVEYTVDPVGVVAQAFKETGGGRFPGRVKPEFYNPCGLKIRHLGLFPETSGDLPLAHQMFPSWQVGARAHVQHLRAYAGWPVTDLVVDPRYPLVTGQWCESFEDLSGKWAPAIDYGQALVAIARRLQGSS